MVRYKLAKGDDYNFSKEIYFIESVYKARRISGRSFFYIKKKSGGEPRLSKRFYNGDLQKIQTVKERALEQKRYYFSKIYLPAIHDGIKYLLVKFTEEHFLRWEPFDDLLIQVPKPVNRFIKKINLIWYPSLNYDDTAIRKPRFNIPPFPDGTIRSYNQIIEQSYIPLLPDDDDEQLQELPEDDDDDDDDDDEQPKPKPKRKRRPKPRASRTKKPVYTDQEYPPLRIHKPKKRKPKAKPLTFIERQRKIPLHDIPKDASEEVQKELNCYIKSSNHYVINYTEIVEAKLTVWEQKIENKLKENDNLLYFWVPERGQLEHSLDDDQRYIAFGWYQREDINSDDENIAVVRIKGKGRRDEEYSFGFHEIVKYTPENWKLILKYISNFRE